MSQERHLMEYLHHLLAYDQTTGLRAWTDAFSEAFHAWDTGRCQRLLAEMRRGDLALSPRGRALALNRHGQWLAQQGEWAAAIHRLEQSLAIFQEAGDTLGKTQALNELGNVYQAIGDWSQAEAYYRQTLPLQRQAGDRRQEAITLNNGCDG